MSEGYCEVDFSDYSDDADPVEFFTVRTATARKAHACNECGGAIATGERYQRASYKFEGKFDMDRRCAACAEVAGEFNYRIFGGDLWAMLRDEWDNGAHVQSCIARLTSVRAKELMQRQWLKWKGLA